VSPGAPETELYVQAHKATDGGAETDVRRDHPPRGRTPSFTVRRASSPLGLSRRDDGRSAADQEEAVLRRSLLVLAVVGLCILAGSPSASAAGGSCPAGWETWTVEAAVDFKLALGYPLTREELLARANAVDANDDQIVCLLDLPDTPAIPPYISGVLDNLASVP
jgi:hypothetical protein